MWHGAAEWHRRAREREDWTPEALPGLRGLPQGSGHRPRRLQPPHESVAAAFPTIACLRQVDIVASTRLTGSWQLGTS
jgi:hypothetical protein